MSHYCCAVFVNNPNDFERILAPFSEQDERYFVFHPLTDEDIEALKQRYYACPEDKRLADTFDGYIDYLDYDRVDGKIGIMSNPNARYDYYTLDGRDYYCNPKEGEVPDATGYFKKSQIDFDAIDVDADYDSHKKFWDEYVLGKNQNSEDWKYELFNPEYYRNKYGTFDKYWNAVSKFVPYAFVTPDGEWVAPGKVGWFAMEDSTQESNDEYDKRFWDFVRNHDDCYVSFVDMHI